MNKETKTQPGFIQSSASSKEHPRFLFGMLDEGGGTCRKLYAEIYQSKGLWRVSGFGRFLEFIGKFEAFQAALSIMKMEGSLAKLQAQGTAAIQRGK